MKDGLHDVVTSILAIAIGLTPAALGAAVTLAYEKGLTWSQKFVQLSVGVCVSYFARNLIDALTSWDAFVLQAVEFVVGMIAYKATPRITGALIERLVELPAAIIDRFFPRKDRP